MVFSTAPTKHEVQNNLKPTPLVHISAQVLCSEYYIVYVHRMGFNYRIAGNFHWCKFSYIWTKSPQNKFSHVLISYARAARPHPSSSPTVKIACSTAMHDDTAPGLWAFLASVAIEGLMPTGLWEGCSMTWQNTSEATRVLWGQGLRNFFERSNFRSFFRIQNTHMKYTKISTIRKFPTIRYVV